MTTIRFARIVGILACLTTAAGVTRAPAAAVSASDARTLSGRVTEPSGGPVAQATVRLVELKRTATSDNDGKYSITQIPPGTYTVSVRDWERAAGPKSYGGWGGRDRKSTRLNSSHRTISY